MELTNWLNKKVHIILSNGFAYLGLVIDCDDNSLTLIDKTNSRVQLKENSIYTIKEISQND